MHTSHSIPITRALVLIGGGHTHALALRSWAMNPLPGVQVTLINPHVKAPYTGMLPGFISGHYKRSELDIDLVRLARRAGARLVTDYATGVDTKRKIVNLSSRPFITYDTLSIDIGITTNLPTIPGTNEHTVSAKPLDIFANAWEAFINRARKDKFNPEIAIIGGGVAGVELSLAMSHRLRAEGFEFARIRLLESDSKIVRDITPAARRSLIAELLSYDIEIITDANVSKVTENNVLFASNRRPISANFITTTAGATPYPWLDDTGLALHKGYIEVDEMLRSVNTSNVFAAGDCAHLTFAPRPKAGVFAVRQAPILLHNLRADLSGHNMVRYSPQKSYLKLISLGQKSALADKWSFTPKGKWVWRIKNHIDQKFMKQFREPPTLHQLNLPKDAALGVKEALENNAPECGGCGSKVAQVPLLEGLSEILDTPLDDAAIVHKENGFEVFTTDHFRTFTTDAWMLSRVAAVQALGDIWAMNGRPEHVLSHIILPRMAAQQHASMLREIMEAAGDVFNACGAKIIGGHTSSGAELTIGFSLSGNVDSTPITLSGAQDGDVIVLTKPIGTGVLLAAEMRQMVDGDDYQKALISMCRLQDKAASLLSTVTKSMTDVTGFGLAGHLMNLLESSGVSADLNLNDIPILNGADTLATKGVRSTLWPSNARLSAKMTFKDCAKSDLLFDPQTCGGLLACVPTSKVKKLVADFNSAKEPLWIIGEIRSGTPHIKLR